MHDSAMAEAKRFVEAYHPTGRIADIGALDINGSLKPLFDGCEYVGLDLIPGAGVDVVLSDPERWDIPSESFDVVVSANCLEHAKRPHLVVLEMARILKPGGLMYLSIPGNFPYHPYPIDCWRVYPDGMRVLLEGPGLTILDVYHNGTDTIGIARKAE